MIPRPALARLVADRAEQETALAAADAQLDLAATTIDGLRAELERQRREYDALAVRAQELIVLLREGQDLIADGQKLIAELQARNQELAGALKADVSVELEQAIRAAFEQPPGRWSDN
jgi:putative N-acetylmannosamine-6-phosphate epimerase